VNVRLSQVQYLFWKEVRQLTRNQVAMLTSLLMPAFLLVLAPLLALLASRTSGYGPVSVPALTARLPGFEAVRTAQDYFLYETLPLLFVLVSLLTPMLVAIPTLIVERERRSLELLLALPVLVDDIVAAKLAAILATAVATTLSMFLVDAVVILTLTPAGTAYVVGTAFLVFSTLVASVGGSLLLGLMARDVRTATMRGALFCVVPLFLTGLCIVAVPGTARFWVLGVLMLGLACGAVSTGLRLLTYERYVV